MNTFLPIYLGVIILLFIALIITNKKKESDDYFRVLLDSVLNETDQAVLAVSPEMDIQSVNKAAEKIFKYEAAGMIGKKLDIFFGNFPGGKIPEKGTVLELRDGKGDKLQVSLSIKALSAKGGEATAGYAVIVKDVSEIKKYILAFEEKALEITKENESLRALSQEIENQKAVTSNKIEDRARVFEEEHARLLESINNLSLGFIMTDQYKNIMLCNEPAIAFLPGLKNKPATIKNLLQSEQVDFDLDQDAERSIVEKITINLAEKQMNGNFVKIFISPIVLEDKKDSIGSIILIKDINDQHRLEESKEDLFSIASHELRTPLTAIYGYISLIKQIYFEEIEDPELNNIINNIGFLSKKLSLSINNFLDSSRLEQDRITLKKEPCDLYAIIVEAIRETERMARDKNLYIKTENPKSPITVIGDQARLIQVLTILISNAVKFSEIGGVRISFEQLVDKIKVSVQDTGSGISEESKRLIFSKFQQTEENLLTKQEGAGLGLHIAKLLMEKMDGNIWIEKTEINQGTTFAFTIPMIIS